MAKDDQQDDVASDKDEAQGKSVWESKKNLVVFSILALVLVAASVGGTIAVLKIFSSDSTVVSDQETDADQPVEPTREPAIYYPLKPELIVTYLARGRHRYAQIGVTLMFRDEDVLNAVELHKPRIMNALNMVLSGQAYEELQTAEGKELVRLECLDALQRIMQEEIGKPGIEQVLFTEFVMQ